MTTLSPESAAATLPAQEAETYAAWFACLAEPMRVRLLHTVATYPGAISVGELAKAVGIRQPTASHHLRKLSEVGFVTLTKVGTSTRVTVNPACCTGLPHAADAVMGLLGSRPCCPTDLPENLVVRPMRVEDMESVARIYAEDTAADEATFEPRTPGADSLGKAWLQNHRWVAEKEGALLGWAAATPVSSREIYAGVAETSVCVAGDARRQGVGKALLHRQVTEADARGLWSLQVSIFPENKAALALHHSAGYRTVGVHERIARVGGHWRDVVLLERRRPDEELNLTDPCCALVPSTH